MATKIPPAKPDAPAKGRRPKYPEDGNLMQETIMLRSAQSEWLRLYAERQSKALLLSVSINDVVRWAIDAYRAQVETRVVSPPEGGKV